MPFNVLLVTPQAVFGELIRLTLEETSLYHVRLTQNGASAISSTRHVPYRLAILDGNLENESLVQLALNLRAAVAGIKVMVIPPANNPHHPLLAGIEPDGYVYQPFYVPDLLDAITGLLGPDVQVEDAASSATLPPAWLEDLGRARQALQNLLPSAAAHSALLICARDAWISAGVLGQVGAQEICYALLRYTASQNQSDLARYVRLSSDNSEHLVYATPLVSGVLLALVFPPTAPVSKLHTQTREASDRLKQQLAELEVTTSPSAPPEIFVPETAPGSARSAAELAFEAFLAELPPPESQGESQAVSDFLFPWEIEAPKPELEPAAPAPAVPVEAPMLSLEDFLANLPQPDAPPATAPLSAKSIEETIRVRPQALEQTMRSMTRLEATTPNLVSSSIEETRAILSRLEETMPAPAASPEDTQPVKVGAAQRRSGRETVEAIHSSLSYTCLLLPRVSSVPLSGELAIRLAEWLPQLCLAFGWQLEGLVIQRQYLQWSVQVPPSISPGNVIRVIRQQTSLRLYHVYPDLHPSQPGDDFWAPGYLVISGTESPSPRTVSDFLQQTRRRQGVTGSQQI